MPDFLANIWLSGHLGGKRDSARKISMALQCQFYWKVLHCPKNSLKVSIKTGPVTVGADRSCLLCVTYMCKQKPDVYRCICSNRYRLGFRQRFQIIFGTVCKFIMYITMFIYVCTGYFYNMFKPGITIKSVAT